MTTSRRLVALPLMLIGVAALCAALVLVTWVVQAQAQEVTPTRDATGDNPPAKPTNLQASEEHDAVTLWARARPGGIPLGDVPGSGRRRSYHFR